MSLFSTGAAPSSLEPARAWGCALANLLLWPGLGTVLGGRKIGLAQMGISGAGVVMAMAGVVGLYGRWFNNLDFPGWRDPYALMIFAGFGLFFLTWLWALFSSLSIVRAASKLGRDLPPRV